MTNDFVIFHKYILVIFVFLVSNTQQQKNYTYASAGYVMGW